MSIHLGVGGLLVVFLVPLHKCVACRFGRVSYVFVLVCGRVRLVFHIVGMGVYLWCQLVGSVG